MTYIKPQVIIHQEFDQSAEAEDTTLRAMIVGPNAVLHRYSNADEKADISLGRYSELPNEINFATLGKTDDGIVDKSSAKLYIDNALLAYYEDLEQADDDTPDIRSGLGETNVVVSDTLVFKTTSDTNDRSECFGDRDVQIGDYVWIQAHVSEGLTDPCEYKTHVSKIIGYSYSWNPATVGNASTTDATSSTESGPTVTPAAATDDLTVTPSVLSATSASAYNALLSGKLDPTYVIEIVGDTTTTNCGRVVTAKITANTGETATEFQVIANEAFPVGQYGYEYRITDLTDVKEGHKWTITQSVPYTTPTLTVGSTYTGLEEDEYTLECIRGGTPTTNTATCPLFKVTTAKGRDYVAEFPIKTTADFVTVGQFGLQVKLSGAVKTGQTYTIAVQPKSEGAYNGLRLQDDIPTYMRSSAGTSIGLNIRLMKRTDLVLDADNDVTPASPNFAITETEYATKVAITPNIKLQDYDFGSKQLNLIDGDVYFEYREWSPTAAGEIQYCTSLSDLKELVPGQLDPDNPLKYGIYKALANSNGVSVGYAAVENPDSADSWAKAFALLEGEESVYSITPLTQDMSILNQAATLIEAESGAEQCRWKTGVFSVKKETTCMVVGQNTLNNELFKTSEDGKIVLATFTDNPDDDVEGKFTIVSITSGNAPLMDYEVKAGDKLRVIISDDVYETYTVAVVKSNDTLVLTDGPSTGYTNKKIEIWHDMTKLEQAEYLGNLAASFGNRRIMVVAPDKVGENGLVLPGYYLAAAVSGFKSGINAYQGMTRTEITGFDDFSLSKPYWSESQLNALASHGVCVVLEDANGTPYIRHALTTDMSDVYHREEAITRDYDYICKQIYSALQRYIGKTSVTDKTLDSIRSGVQSLLLQLRQSDYIRDYSDLEVQQHTLLADHVEVTVTLAMPFPINVIEVYVTASKG